MCQWKWGDSGVTRSISRKNPLRWSGWSPLDETVRELKQEELKHEEPKPEHLRQVSCYAAMYQAKLEENRARSDNPDSMPAAVAPAAVLMNTKKGTVEQVNAVRPAKVADMARAVQLQLWARAVAANNEDRVVPCDEAMSAGGIIALDVETDSYGCLIEIGAVACARFGINP